MPYHPLLDNAVSAAGNAGAVKQIGDIAPPRALAVDRIRGRAFGIELPPDDDFGALFPNPQIAPAVVHEAQLDRANRRRRQAAAAFK